MPMNVMTNLNELLMLKHFDAANFVLSVISKGEGAYRVQKTNDRRIATVVFKLIRDSPRFGFVYIMDEVDQAANIPILIRIFEVRPVGFKNRRANLRNSRRPNLEQGLVRLVYFLPIVLSQPPNERRQATINIPVRLADLLVHIQHSTRLEQFSFSQSTTNIRALLNVIDRMPFVLTETECLVESFLAVSDNVASDKAHSHRLQLIQQSLA